MYVVDMHCDTLSDVSESVGLVNKYNMSKKYPMLQFFAHFSKADGRTAEERRAKAIRDLNVFLYECERLGLQRVGCGKELFEATDYGKRAALLSIEGGGGLFADSHELSTLYRGGLAVLGLAWNKNELSASAYDEEDTGLTEEGKKMLSRCGELGITVDVSHLSDKAFYDVFAYSPLPHIATHSNFRSLCNVKRNLTDDMAKMIAARGGVIGLNLFPKFLREGGDADLNDLLRHVDYGLELVGDRCLGFGFDVDGTRGVYPKGISTEESIHDRVIDFLLSHYSATTVERIAGLNVIEFLQSNLP